MKTKAAIKGHPVHQMLIPFPIAFLTGSLFFDIAGLIFNNSSLWTTGAYLALAGIVMAFITAVPGFIDYLFSVPPKSTGKQRATKHMIINLSAVVIFIAASGIRLPAESQPGTLVVLLEAAGSLLLGIGGWLGGTLVTRNFIGPDHRYAGAGKWKETKISADSSIIKVADNNELKLNQMKLIRLNDQRIVLAKAEDAYYAFDDSCSHRGGSLAGGVLICGTVHCLWHGSQFDIKTGSVKAGPAQERITTYTVVEKADGIYLNVQKNPIPAS